MDGGQNEFILDAPATGDLPLEFQYDLCGSSPGGPYEFTARVQHTVRLSLAPMSTPGLSSTVAVAVHYPAGPATNDSSSSEPVARGRAAAAGAQRRRRRLNHMTSPGFVVAQLDIGSIVAGCGVECVLGQGGMGTVYRGWQAGLERHVALKVIRPDLAGDATARARFMQEARLAAALEHPNAVPVYQVAEEQGRPVLVMRYVDGVDLASVLHEQGALSVGRTIAIAEQAAAALTAAHRRGIVHRDVKPANILIEPHDGREHVFLGDFGIAKAIAETSKLTQTGYGLGTLDYCAPEQIEGGAITGAADTYALGCVVFEMLTGRVPFPADSQAGKLWGQIHGEIPRVNDAGAGVSPALERAVACAMAKDPDDRWPSPAAFARAMRATVIEQGSTVGESSASTLPTAHAATAVLTRQQPARTAPQTARTTRRRHSGLLMVGALAAAAVAAAGLAMALALGGSSSGHLAGSRSTRTDAGVHAPSKKSRRKTTRVKQTRAVTATTTAPTTTPTPTASRVPTASSPQTQPPAGQHDWPDGTDAYTAIVRSSASRSQSRQAVRRLAAKGYPGGVLRSDEYSHLRPGYWVAFSGTYGTLAAATAHVAELRGAGFDDAYPRFVNGAR